MAPLRWQDSVFHFRCCCARPAITPDVISSWSSARRSWRQRRAVCPGASCWSANISAPRGGAGGPGGPKYRVMMIGGKIYPLHLAISRNWKVHYFTSDMADKPDHRSEEAAFLADMPAVLGDKAYRALEG